jgi:hypothetical protein
MGGCEYGCDVGAVSTFMNPESMEIVMAMVVGLTTALDQVSFDSVILNQEFSQEAFVTGLMMTAPDSVALLEYEELPGLGDIGDNSSGITMALDYGFLVMHADFVMFRRDQVGVIVVVAYPDGVQTSISLGELSRTLDARAVETLQYQP